MVIFIRIIMIIIGIGIPIHTIATDSSDLRGHLPVRNLRIIQASQADRQQGAIPGRHTVRRLRRRLFPNVPAIWGSRLATADGDTDVA